MNTPPTKINRRAPYSLLVGVLSVPAALVVLQLGFELVRRLFQGDDNSWFAGLGQALWVLFGVLIATVIANLLALWSARADPATPYRKAAIYACSVSLGLCVYFVLASLFRLPMISLVLWAPR
jgi:hypothetical protein